METTVRTNYYSEIKTGEYVAVAKGQCDCAAPNPHPLVVLEQIIIAKEDVLKTWSGEYSRLTGNRVEGIGGEYDKILDPEESLDGKYVLLEFSLAVSKNNIQDSYDEDEKSLHAYASEKIEQELNRVTEKIVNRI